MSHPIRRQVLALIAEQDPRQRAEFEPGGRVRRKPDPERYRIELYHRHLPVLDDAGFVRWDRAEDVVTKGPRFQDVRPLVELVREHRGARPGERP